MTWLPVGVEIPTVGVLAIQVAATLWRATFWMEILTGKLATPRTLSAFWDFLPIVLLVVVVATNCVLILAPALVSTLCPVPRHGRVCVCGGFGV